MSLREWLSVHLDGLLGTMLVAVVVAALVGFIKRSTGAAIFVSCACSCMVALIAYPWVSDFGWNEIKVVLTLGVAAGLCALGLFKIAMKISDRLGERDTELADELINKAKSFVPGGGKP